MAKNFATLRRQVHADPERSKHVEQYKQAMRDAMQRAASRAHRTDTPEPKRVNRGYRLRADLIKACKRMALEQNRPLYAILEDALEQYLTTNNEAPVRLVLELSPTTRRNIKVRAAQEGLTIKDYIVRLLARDGVRCA